MNQILPPLLVCALLMPLEAALLPFLPLGLSARAELPLCAVVLLTVGPASTSEGAVGCFFLGALADVSYRVQPGLFTLTALLLFVLLRLGPFGRETPGPFAFAAVVALAVALQALLVFALLWIAGRPRPEGPWWGVAAGAVFSAAVAPLFYRLCALGTKLLVRDDPSLLR